MERARVSLTADQEAPVPSSKPGVHSTVILSQSHHPLLCFLKTFSFPRALKQSHALHGPQAPPPPRPRGAPPWTPLPHAPAAGSVCAQGRPLCQTVGPAGRRLAHCCIPEVKHTVPPHVEVLHPSAPVQDIMGQTPGAGAEHRGRDRPLGPTWGWGDHPHLGYPVPRPGCRAPLTDSLLPRFFWGSGPSKFCPPSHPSPQA